MPAVWKSAHPDVLAWWADVQKRERSYVRLIKKVEKETGRQIYVSTGFGDDRVIGLSSHSFKEEPPPGWKFGHGDRYKGFFEPRITPRKKDEKPACEEAQALIKKLNEKRVSVREECHERFGTPTFHFFGLHVISPGFEEHDGVLWMTFGTHDYEAPPKNGLGRNAGGPKMLDYFEPAKLSEYYATREAAGLDAAV